MRKISKKNNKQNKLVLRLHHQMNDLMRDWDLKVMSYVMMVVVMIAVIAATVAWFQYFRTSSVKNMNLATASSDALKVEVKKKDNLTFVEVTKDNEESISAYMDMPVFDNVEKYEVESEEGQGTISVSKMAPGVYGSITVKLTPLNKLINHYKISPQAVFIFAGQTGEADRYILEQLAKGHILFFAKRQEIPIDSETGKTADKVTIDGVEYSIDLFTHNNKYVYYEQIESSKFIDGELSWDDEKDVGIEKEVEIYWYWPFEYANLSSEIRNVIALPGGSQSLGDIITDKRLQFFDKYKMQEIVSGSESYNETQLYDYADTRIGTCVEKIRLRVEVVGYHAEEAGP